MEFSKRMDQFGEGVFSKLAKLRREKTAKGEDVIDLSIGAPNIPPAPHIIQALTDAAREPGNYIYAISDQPALLKAVSQWYQNRYGALLDPESQICSLLGSQEGLSHIAMTIVNEGDVVLVPDPCYPIFGDGPRLAGAELYFMPQKKEHGYLIQFSHIPEDIAKRAKLMVVSYPNNPTTAVAPDSFYRELVAFAKKYDIIVLHDNAYSELVFDGKRCGSFLSYPGAIDIGVEFNSLSKTYGLAGARVGFCLGNAQVVSRLKTLKSNMDYGMFLPIQQAAIAAITGDQSCVSETRQAYELRRNLICDGFTSIGWPMEKPAATMFIWAKIPDGFPSSEAFVMELAEKSGVIVTPGSAFGPSGEGYVRLAMVQGEDEIRSAVQAVDRCGILREH